MSEAETPGRGDRPDDDAFRTAIGEACSVDTGTLVGCFADAGVDDPEAAAIAVAQAGRAGLAAGIRQVVGADGEGAPGVNVEWIHRRAGRVKADPRQLTLESVELRGEPMAAPMATDGGDRAGVDDLRGEAVPARYYRPGGETRYEYQPNHRYAEGIYA